MHNEALVSALAEILPRHPQGIGEFDLLTILQQAPYALFDKDALTDPLLMFQSHFVLFNALYLLRDRWLREQRVCLEMVLTHIRILPYHSAEAGLVKANPLRAYYLDWRNFSDTDKEDVQGLIDSFWQQIQGVLVKKAIKPAELTKAYATLLLPRDADFPQIKRQYFKLLHLAHPDKGGDTGRTQEIEHAYRLLKSLSS
ncbi:MAG: hypothetical protein ACI8Z9_001230 [Paraglaciecola sp.]